MYQIYPRSFSDSNGDGLGDIKGITAKVPYLKELGIDAVWLSPFYPSALADGGYDVDDYRDVDPKLGTLEDFDEMSAALHAAGIKLIADIVPNHSSNRHEWFQEALASPRGSAARERYIFRDGKGENGEIAPSDWESVFGGPAWERITEPDGTPGQWYMHIFAKEQPDLNWANREIRDDFLKTLRFWSDRGVDGFRVDVAHALTKDLTEPLLSKVELSAANTGTDGCLDGSHPFWDRDEVHEIYAEWREVFNEYNPPRTAVAEAWVHASRRAPLRQPARAWARRSTSTSCRPTSTPSEFREIITRNLAEATESGASSTWVFSNHDVVRHATRYGLPKGGGKHAKGQDGKGWLLAGAPAEELDVELGLRRARAATLLMLALPGSAYLYQGEELGLQEVAEIPDAERQDPTFFRNKGVEIGRDGCRVPLPWAAGGHLVRLRRRRRAPAAAGLVRPLRRGRPQDGVDGSTLELYRKALKLRRELQTSEELEWQEAGSADVLHFSRPGGWQTVTNFGDTPGRAARRRGAGQQRPAGRRTAAGQHHRLAAVRRRQDGSLRRPGRPGSGQELIYGCMGLGGSWSAEPYSSADVDEAAAAVEAALAAGITLFDHADIYRGGKSEAVFGEVLGFSRGCGNGSGCRPSAASGSTSRGLETYYDLSRDAILERVNGSLKRLKTDYVDVLLLHRPDPLADPAEVASAVGQLMARRQGAAGGRVQHVRRADRDAAGPPGNPGGGQPAGNEPAETGLAGEHGAGEPRRGAGSQLSARDPGVLPPAGDHPAGLRRAGPGPLHRRPAGKPDAG